jgi:hypothetical protein
MPQRIHSFIGAAWHWALALYEPVIFYLGGLIAAAATSLHMAGAAPGWREAFAGYGVGVVVDLVARGRAYARLPVEQRKSRLREWKERLLWGAVGLGFGWTISLFINGLVLIKAPQLAPFAAPAVNMMSVIAAIPMIDLSRGVLRKLGGASTQDAAAGLVIDWVNRRAGRRESASAPQQGGGHDDQPRP